MFSSLEPNIKLRLTLTIGGKTMRKRVAVENFFDEDQTYTLPASFSRKKWSEQLTVRDSVQAPSRIDNREV